MAGQERTLQSRVVQTALEACRRVDQSVRVANMTEDADGTTYLRVRAGDAHSVASLQQALQQALDAKGHDVMVLPSTALKSVG